MKYDPRAIKLFSQLDLAAPVLAGLPAVPTGAQTKMLAANFSGLDVFARAAPGSGKSTAAAASLAGSNRLLSGLVLVPTPTLAAQYAQMLESLGTKPRVLFRTGEIEADQLQHRQPNRNVLVATPQRVLDYLTFDPKLLPFSLEKLVVDELELFQSNANRPSALEQLMEHLLEHNTPCLTLIANTRRKLRFNSLERILLRQSERRQLVQVAEKYGKPKTTIKVLRHTGQELDLDARHFFPAPSAPIPIGRILDTIWDKQALVLVPDSTSHQPEMEATVVKYSEISGINMGLDNLLVVGWQPEWDLAKLACQVKGTQRSQVTICLPSDDNVALKSIYEQLDELATLAE